MIEPGWGWSFDHEAGQYIGIGVEVQGPLPLAGLLAVLGAAARHACEELWQEADLEKSLHLGVPVLGQQLVQEGWAVVVTGGFELERPSERGAPVLFHPNAVTSTDTATPG